MAEGYRTFGSQVKTSGKLHEMLNQEGLTPEKLFSINNITGDINQNIQAFLNFCKKRKQFTIHMLKVCLNSTYEQLDNQNIKKIAQHTIEVLTNDEDALTDFLFQKQEEIKNGSDIIQEKLDEQQTNQTSAIQSQAQRLFNDTPTKKTQAVWQNQKDVFSKYQLVRLTLDHLFQPVKNQTCLGYINKLYSSLLRREGNLFLQFLTIKPQYIDLLIQNMKYFSIGNIIALALACQDKSGEYKHQNLKKKIFQKILDYGFQNITNTEKFQGFLATAEEILNSTKQSYYQYFEDFKRCANILVSQQILRKFFAKLNDGQLAFGNAASYLELILKRINSETQQHDYYRQNQNNQPTMKFQHLFFINELDQLLNFIGKSQKYCSMARVSYLGFLMSFLKNIQGKEMNVSNSSIFKRLIVFYQQEKAQGIPKNYLFQLLKAISKKLNQSQAKEIGDWLLNANVQIQILRNILQDPSSSLKSNSNGKSCFILSILFDIQNKENTFLENYSTGNNLNLKLFYEKHKTKLANYGQQQELVSPICEQIELSFKLATKNKFNGFITENDDQKQQKDEEEKNKQKQQEGQVVGKHSVIIPVLNLPTKLDNMARVTAQQQIVEPVKTQVQSMRDALIRDLKNTKIDLPEKFLKSKKSQSLTQAKQPVKKIQELSLNQVTQNQAVKIDQTNPEKKIVPILPGTDIQEQKYFIRHILLF